MTTTNMFQGLQGDKSSSRVLQPPGGGSSNIFGGDAAAAAPKAKAGPKPDNNIFGTADANPAPPTRKVNTTDNIFGEPKSTPTPQKPAGTFNPITGESVLPEKKNIPSTKVRQPPGGASSQLW